MATLVHLVVFGKDALHVLVFQRSNFGRDSFLLDTELITMLLFIGQFTTAWLHEAVGHETSLGLEILATH